jgi:hypothetical protein
MWQNPFASPGPRNAVETASVWFTAYPISFITRPGESFLAALGDEELWKAFATIGIDAVHTGPVKRAGGLAGWQATPSVDGHFDRISTEIDPAFGDESEFRAMCGMATWYGGADHRRRRARPHRQGRDFRLAEMKHADYPGHLPHGRDRARGLEPAARGPGRAGLGEPGRPRARRRCRRPATSSGGCSG